MGSLCFSCYTKPGYPLDINKRKIIWDKKILDKNSFLGTQSFT